MKNRWLGVSLFFLLISGTAWAEQDFYGIQMRSEEWARALVLNQGEPDPADLLEGPVLSHAIHGEASLRDIDDRHVTFQLTVFNDSPVPIPAEYDHRDFFVYTRTGRKISLIDEEEDLPGFIEPRSKLSFAPSFGNLPLTNSEVEMIVCSFDLGRTKIILFPWSKKEMVSKLVSPALPPPPPPVEEEIGVGTKEEIKREIKKELKEELRKEIKKEVEEGLKKEIKKKEPEKEVRKKPEKKIDKKAEKEVKKRADKEAKQEVKESPRKKKAVPEEGPRKKTPGRNFWDWLAFEKKDTSPDLRRAPVMPTAVEKRTVPSAPAVRVSDDEINPATQEKLDKAIQQFVYAPADVSTDRRSASPSSPAASSAPQLAAVSTRTEAHVIDVNRPFNFVTLNLGQQDGLKQNMTLSILREGKLVAKARVKQVREAVAAASIIPDSVRSEIRAGDSVAFV